MWSILATPLKSSEILSNPEISTQVAYHFQCTIPPLLIRVAVLAPKIKLGEEPWRCGP